MKNDKTLEDIVEEELEKQGLTEFTVINDADPNTTFTVTAKDVNEAHRLALQEMGWWIAKSKHPRLKIVGL